MPERVHLRTLAIGLFIFWLAAGALRAQSFASTYGTPLLEERLEQLGSLQPTSDGGYVLLGNVWPPAGHRWHLAVMKLSASGAIEWRWWYVTLQVTAGQIRQTADGGYIVGATLGRDTPLDAGGLIVMRLDPLGNIVWQRRIGGFERDIFRGLTETSDKGILIGGEAEITRGRAVPILHLWILKLSPDGKLIWQRTYFNATSPADSLQMLSFRVTPDDGAVVGALNRDVSNSAYVLKVNAAGEVDWAASYSGMRWPSSVSPTVDGDYVLTGTAFDPPPRLSKVAVVARLDATANVVWAKKMFDPRGEVSDNTAVAARETADLTIAVVADTRIPGPSANNDVWVVRLDPSGGALWQSIYDNGRENLAAALEPTSDNGVAIAGTTAGRGSRSFDWLLLKLNDAGGVPECADVQPALGSVEPATVVKGTLLIKTGSKAPNPLVSDLVQAAASMDLLEACGKF